MPLSRSIDVDAPAEAVWALASDLPRMGELSPENTGGRWVGGDGPAVGVKFRGKNRNGWRRWGTTSVVTVCEPGRRFAFDVSSFGLPVATWSYDVQARPSGCRVTETWTDRRGVLISKGGALATGVSDREGHTARSIETTLERLKAAAERSSV